MQKSFFAPIFALCLSALLTACAIPDRGYVRIDPTLQEVTLIGTNPKDITLEASDDWYVRILYAEGDTLRWLNATPLSGRPDETTFTLTAKTPNYTSAPRQADVQIKLPGDAGTIIRVTQQTSVKPDPLTMMTRSLTGATLEGPAQLTFEYDEESNSTIAFSDGTNRYTNIGGSSVGSIVSTPIGAETGSSFTYSVVNNRISSFGPLQWDFYDRNTGILMQRSKVSYNFSYDRSEDKKLSSITRTEVFTIENGTTLEESREQSEIYEFAYDNLRIVSVTHTLPYLTSQPSSSRAKLIYTFTYPETDTEIQENNLTTNVWDMIVMPFAQGTPFYSLTGFGIFGLTGDTQGNFPISAQVEYIAPAPEENNAATRATTSLPQQVTYTFERDNGALTGAQTVTTYDDHTETAAAAFSYIPLEKPDEGEGEGEDK